MKKTKLKLAELAIHSFVTSMDVQDKKTAKGAGTNDTRLLPDPPTQTSSIGVVGYGGGL